MELPASLELRREGGDGEVAVLTLARPGKPEEVAATIAFLASEEAGYITGQALRVNGGMYV